MTANKWGLVVTVLTLLGLGFAAMSINQPFTVASWIPSAFFVAAGLVFLWLVISLLMHKHEHLNELTKALTDAQVSAKELMTLNPDTNIKSAFSKGRATIVIAGDKYKAAIKILQREHLGKKTKRGIQIDSLIKSLHQGRSILDVCNRNNSIAAFKHELDKNSPEIISQVDALFTKEYLGSSASDKGDSQT
jgi:hypothetical protein